MPRRVRRRLDVRERVGLVVGPPLGRVEIRHRSRVPHLHTQQTGVCACVSCGRTRSSASRDGRSRVLAGVFVGFAACVRPRTENWAAARWGHTYLGDERHRVRRLALKDGEDLGGGEDGGVVGLLEHAGGGEDAHRVRVVAAGAEQVVAPQRVAQHEGHQWVACMGGMGVQWVACMDGMGVGTRRTEFFEGGDLGRGPGAEPTASGCDLRRRVALHECGGGGIEPSDAAWRAAGGQLRPHGSWEGGRLDRAGLAGGVGEAA